MHILVKVSCVTLHGAMYIRLHSVSIYMQTTLRMQCTTYQDNCLYNVCSSHIQPISKCSAGFEVVMEFTPDAGRFLYSVTGGYPGAVTSLVNYVYEVCPLPHTRSKLTYISRYTSPSSKEAYKSPSNTWWTHWTTNTLVTGSCGFDFGFYSERFCHIPRHRL